MAEGPGRGKGVQHTAARNQKRERRQDSHGMSFWCDLYLLIGPTTNLIIWRGPFET